MIKASFLNSKRLLSSLLTLAFSGSAFATVLFTEDFTAATSGQKWDGYNGWQEIVSEGGTKWLTIRKETKISTGMVGAFRSNADTPGSDGAGAVKRMFDESYSLAEGAYRLSFVVQGRIHRPFQVTLMDSEGNRVGLQLGYGTLDDYNISGVHVNGESGVRTLYRDGGYWMPRPGASAPDGWVYSEYYTVYIDINGTASAMEIDGLTLDAGQGRIVYNAKGGSGPSYTILFDLPTEFLDIAGLMLVKESANSVSWNVGDFTLERTAIPEPAAVGMILGGAIAVGCLTRFRLH